MNAFDNENDNLHALIYMPIKLFTQENHAFMFKGHAVYLESKLSAFGEVHLPTWINITIRKEKWKGFLSSPQ